MQIILSPQAGMTTVRLGSPEFEKLKVLLFSRYPQYEWATFARFGWRENNDTLMLSMAALDVPSPGDLNDKVGHVMIFEPYSLRMALAAEKHPLAVGVIHSHPRECAPRPSSIDDDMDSYYAEYFQGFAPGRPYVSLIVSSVEDEIAISGRVFFKGIWRTVHRFVIERTPVTTWVGGHKPHESTVKRARLQRLTSAFGEEADKRLQKAVVAVIGAGGTGSPAIEVLVRAGVGHLIIVDPDHLVESNLERVHGSNPMHAQQAALKVAIAKEHVHSIDPTCKVQAFVGALPQAEIIDAVMHADLIVGCTDSQHSRLAISDLSTRYLIPAIDCGVMLEGGEGKVTGQITQFVRFLSSDPCALCRKMIIQARLSQELMSQEERAQRRAAAQAARTRGEDGSAYWLDEPQLNTVGYLTTATGALAAGYAIGWLTGRFEPPFARLQMNFIAPYFDVTDQHEGPRPECPCRLRLGWADQGNATALITAPTHWPKVKKL